MIRAGITLISLLFAAHAQTVIPELVQSFPIPSDPSHLAAPTPVQLLIDPAGNVTAIDTMLSVPDEAVNSLRRWRFAPGIRNGKPDAFSIEIAINLRRPSDYFVATSIQSSLGLTQELAAQIEEGLALAWDKAINLDRKLAKEPKDVSARTKLVVAAALRAGSDAREIHARNLAWLVSNDPLNPVLGTRYARISTVEGPFGHVGGYESVKKAWQSQLASRGALTRIASHAAQFFEFTEPAETERLLSAQVPRFALAPVWMGNLYGRSLLGVSWEHPKSGDPEFNPATGDVFRSRARTALDETKDQRVLFGAIHAVKEVVRFHRNKTDVPAPVMRVCADLVEKLRALGGTIDDCGSPAKAPAESAGVDNIKPAKMLEQPRPAYPKMARDAGIQGKVQFHAVIGKDGRVRELELRQGKLIFYDDSRAAALRWKYTPMVYKGEPVEVITTIEANFTLER